MTPLLAADVPDFLLLPLKILALVGFAALGGWVVGVIAWTFAKFYFAQKIPPWLMWFVRTLGFTACGLLAYFWLFGTGGGGLGFGPGGGSGGKDGGPAPKKDETSRKEKDKDKKEEKKKDEEKISPEQSLRVEVLGDAAVKRVAKSADFERRYRLAKDARLVTLDELKGRMLELRAARPPLRRLEIILYNDSPARDRPVVALLETWARDRSTEKEPLSVQVAEEGRDAP